MPTAIERDDILHPLREPAASETEQRQRANLVLHRIHDAIRADLAAIGGNPVIVTDAMLVVAVGCFAAEHGPRLAGEHFKAIGENFLRIAAELRAAGAPDDVKGPRH